MIYITGDLGFIATHLKRELSNYELAGADIKDIFNTDFREPGTALREFRKYKPDLVIHNAAQVGRLFGEEDPRYTIDSNVLMTTHVARACAELGIKLMYFSTSEVYGDQGEEVCYEEGAMVIPHNLYGLTKRFGEEVCKLYCNELQIIRLSMPFGIGLPSGIGRAAIVNFIYNAVHGLPITVHKDSERSWCWVGDTVRAIRMVIEKGKNEAYNVGRVDNFTSMLEVAKLACKITGASTDLIQMVDAPKNQTKIKRLSNKKIIDLGWTPEVSLEEGMKIMAKYL